MKARKKRVGVFVEGIWAGIPIGLGYFAVAFSLGIVARNAGLNPFQGFVASALNLASAGEYALFSSIQAGVTYAEVALATLVVNARYFLMSCSLSQRFSPDTKFYHRFLIGFGLTDELFGIAIGREGPLNPKYSYGAFTVAIPLWALGTALGIVAGTYLPVRIVSALSVSLYGMFIAIIIPPARKKFSVACAVASSFVLSFACSRIPVIRDLSSGTRTIILTVLISSVIALIFPVDESTESAEPKENGGDESMDCDGGEGR
ncbi:MAG: AzlC family ABC transporter permease [Treponema sp.]|nr:AzlC family ABC transporter permease [Treponema sp.]